MISNVNEQENQDKPNINPISEENDNKFVPNINPPVQEGEGGDIIENPQINPGGIQKEDDSLLFPTMKKIKELKENKKYFDPNPQPIPEEQKKKEEEEKKENEHEENEPLEQQQNKVSEIPIANVQSEFKNLFNKNMLQNNSYRRRLLHMLIVIIIINCILWEVLCLFMGVCYGENVVMQGWLSQTICPLIFILLICYVFLFFCSDYLYKPGIQVANILIILLLLMFIGFGVYSLIRGLGISSDTLTNRYNELSINSQNFFDGIQDFKDTFKINMIVTAVFYLFIALTGIVLIIFSYQFFYLLTETAFDWRPPLRSRLHDDRAQRILNLYAIYNEEFRRLYEAEHKKKEENVPKEIVNQQQQPLGNNEIPAEGVEMQNLNKNKDIQKEDAPLQTKKEEKKEEDNNGPSHQLGEGVNTISNINPSAAQPKKRRLPPLKKNI